MPDDPTTDVLIDQFVPNPTTMLKEGDIKRASDFRSVYSNNTAFNTSAFDFAMTFGEILDAGGGNLYVEQKVRVVMSPLHAKIFAAIFMNNVRNYEAQFGEIKIPGQEQNESYSTANQGDIPKADGERE